MMGWGQEAKRILGRRLLRCVSRGLGVLTAIQPVGRFANNQSDRGQVEQTGVLVNADLLGAHAVLRLFHHRAIHPDPTALDVLLGFAA